MFKVDRAAQTIIERIKTKENYTRVLIKKRFRFRAWLIAAIARPDLKFFIYTKKIKLLIKYQDLVGDGIFIGLIPNIIPIAITRKGLTRVKFAVVR